MAEVTIDQLRKMTANEKQKGNEKDNEYLHPAPPMSTDQPFPQRSNIWLANEGYTTSGIPVYNRSTPPPESTTTTSTTTTTTTIPIS